jgi:hypothetical protein
VDDKQTVVKHVASWLKKDWVVNEIEQLRQDAEEAHVTTCTQEAKADKWYGAYERKNDQFNRLKEHFDSKISQTNAGLKNKCMILLDLIEEYDRALTAQAAYGGVKITTTKINELRQRGGFSV